MTKKTRAKSTASKAACGDWMACVEKIYQHKTRLAEKYLSPILLLLIRLAVGYVFFTSGLLKLPEGFLGIGQGDWSTTILLFEYEHPVPVLALILLVYVVILIEVLAKSLSLLSVSKRFAQISFVIMTGVVILFYAQYGAPGPILPPMLAAYLGATTEVVAPLLLFVGIGARLGAFVLLFMTLVIEFSYQHDMDHIYWALLLAVILIQGAGTLSADYLVKKKYLKHSK